MQIDDKIYPINSEISNDNFDFTKNFSELDLNEKINNNIVYSSSNSAYADLANKVIFSWYYTNKGKFKIIEDCGKYNYQSVMLTNQLAGGIFSYATSNQEYNSLYDQRFGYDISALNNYYNYNYLVRGFKYYSLCGCIYVEYFTSDGGASTNIVDLNTFDTNYSDKKIRRVLLTLYSGTNGGRSSTSIQFSNYNDYVIPFFILASALDETNYEISYENIINYFPRFSSASNEKQHGITIIAGIVSGSYLTTAITTPTIKGGCYNRSNYTGLNWETVTDVTYNTTNIATFMPDFAYNKNDILAMAATYGVMFSDKESIAKTLDLTNAENLINENLYFPVQEADGLWQGRYTHGNENTTNKIVSDDWNNDKNSPFINGSPSVDKIDPNKYEDDFGLVYSSPIMGFTNKYLMSVDQLINLAKFLNNEDETKFEMILHNLEFAGTNPLNCVTSIQYMPVNIGVVNYNPVNIVLGKLTCNEEITGISGGISGTLLTNANPQVYCGWCYCPLEHENYLDYAPYTAYMMYLPFAGYVDLDADVVSGKYIQVYMNIDVYSGSCIYDIRVSGDSSNHGNRYKTVAGNVSTPISIQGTDSNAFANSLMQNITRSFQCAGSFTNSAIDIGVSNALIETLNDVGIEDFTKFGAIKTGLEYVNRQAKSVSNAAVNAGNFLSSIYSVLATPMTFTEVGSASGNAMKNMATQVFLYRYTMVDNADDKYGEFIGYACEFSEALSNLSGFTVCANVRLDGFNATETEKNIIKAILESGFYIT